MQVKSIAECSKGSILQYFRPSSSYHLSLRSLFCLFLSGRFTQVLLYVYGSAHEIFVLIADAQNPLLNAHDDIFSLARDLNFGLSLPLYPYFVYASSICFLASEKLRLWQVCTFVQESPSLCCLTI